MDGQAGTDRGENNILYTFQKVWEQLLCIQSVNSLVNKFLSCMRVYMGGGGGGGGGLVFTIH